MEGVKTALAGAGSCVLCLLGTACSILTIIFVGIEKNYNLFLYACNENFVKLQI